MTPIFVPIYPSIRQPAPAFPARPRLVHSLALKTRLAAAESPPPLSPPPPPAAAQPMLSSTGALGSRKNNYTE